MRHRKHFRKLNRTAEHRRALRRNMAQSLFEHGAITTTLPKAKDLRPFAERLITLAVKARKHSAARNDAAALRARRDLERLLGDRSTILAEHQDDYDLMSDAVRAKTLRMPSGRRHRTGEPKGRLAFTGQSVVHRLMEQIAPKFEQRPGGYTRVIRLSTARLGDAAPKAVLQLVGEEESPGAVTRPEGSARRRRADARYALAIQLTKSRGAPAKTEETAESKKSKPQSAEDERDSENAAAGGDES